MKLSCRKLVTTRACSWPLISICFFLGAYAIFASFTIITQMPWKLPNYWWFIPLAFILIVGPSIIVVCLNRIMSFYVDEIIDAKYSQYDPNKSDVLYTVVDKSYDIASRSGIFAKGIGECPDGRRVALDKYFVYKIENKNLVNDIFGENFSCFRSDHQHSYKKRINHYKLRASSKEDLNNETNIKVVNLVSSLANKCDVKRVAFFTNNGYFYLIVNAYDTPQAESTIVSEIEQIKYI